MGVRETQGKSRPVGRRRRSWPEILAIVAVAVVAIVFAYFARTGAVSDRIRNPAVTGAPREVEYLFGLSGSTWVTVAQLGTLISMSGALAIFVLAWRRRPGHPVLLMAIVTTLMILLDPITNWAPFGVYNPQVWHLPEDWWLVSISPTVQPFVVLGYAAFYLTPYFPASWMLRKLQAQRPPDAFVWRHPLISLAAIILPIGFALDAMLEISAIRTGLYIYSQVVPFGSVFVGTPFQFPLLWVSLGVALVMVPVGVLLYVDDTGRCVAEKLAQRARIFPRSPKLGTFTVMLVIMNLVYVGYVVEFTIIRWSGAATAVACPWPYPEAKVYDPQGLYEKNGQPGPYFAGEWSGWMTGQPEGRPQYAPPADRGRCGQEGLR